MDGHQTALERAERTDDLTPAPTAASAQKAKPGPGLSSPVPDVPWTTVARDGNRKPTHGNPVPDVPWTTVKARLDVTGDLGLTVRGDAVCFMRPGRLAPVAFAPEAEGWALAAWLDGFTLGVAGMSWPGTGTTGVQAWRARGWADGRRLAGLL